MTSRRGSDAVEPILAQTTTQRLASNNGQRRTFSVDQNAGLIKPSLMERKAVDK